MDFDSKDMIGRQSKRYVFYPFQGSDLIHFTLCLINDARKTTRCSLYPSERLTQVHPH